VGSGRVARSVTSRFSGLETFDIGMDLRSPFSLDYHERAPFKIIGKIEKINIKYI
jgi:arylsulfatase